MQTDKFIHREVKAGRTIDVTDTLPCRSAGDQERGKISGAGTSLAMQMYNEKLAIRALARIINENFCKEDWFLTLTYERTKRPDPSTAKKDLSLFLRRLRRLYDKCGKELKYVRVTAYGERGGIHHHIIVSGGVDTRLINQLWKNSKIQPRYSALYDTGEYSSLAAYLVRQGNAGKSPGEFLTGKSWSGSRNLKKPKPYPPKEIELSKWNDPPKPKSGYLIDTDSIDEGINPVNGHPFRFYRMIRIPPDSTVTTPDGRLLKDDAAARWINRQNRDYLKNHWKNIVKENKSYE